MAADGRGPGLEIIGFSGFRGFPDVTDEYAASFRELVDEVGLVPTSLAINTDVGIRRDRLMTDDELVEYMRRRIEAAAKLGFPIARVQISLTPDSMEAKARAYQNGSVLACLKHFVGYGMAEGGRDYNTADASEQRLRNVYLEPFRQAVLAGRPP